MDTTYYSFETKKVKVSGGADLLTIVPAPAASPAGEVLDFDRCRRKLETKAAWNGLARAVEEVKSQAGGEEAYEAAAGGAVYQPVPAAAPAERPAPARTRRGAVRAKASTVKAPRVSPIPRLERAGGWLELCASVATLLVCVCAGWAFLALV